MAEIWAAAAAVVAAGATVYASNKQAGAAKAGQKASQNASQQAIDQQNMNYDRSATQLNPYINAGTNALGQMDRVNNGDYSAFMNAPDYQFTRQQGLQGLDRSAAARGGLLAGGHSADVLNYASGLASQQLGNYYSRLGGMASQGQNAASNLGSIGAGQAGAIGSYLQNNAQNQTAGAQNQANAYGQMASGLAGAFGQYAGSQYNPSASSYAPTQVNSGGGVWGTDYTHLAGTGGGSSYSLGTAGTGVG